jgi:hypothetical protein
VCTAALFAGVEGISMTAISPYLNTYLDGPFEIFIDKRSEGTPFITEILKTIYDSYLKGKDPVIRKALKLALAQNLTFIERGDQKNAIQGLIQDEKSKFNGKIAAPLVILH